jgi:signal transduction histidine kinase
MAQEGLERARHHLSDDELITELKRRFDQTKQALYDIRIVTKKLEEVNRKLEESERVKSNFLSNIKNEINNPLTVILGLSQTLMRFQGNDPDLVKQVARSIHGESFNLDFQLRNIFSAAELESGETSLEVAMVNIETVINDVLDSFQYLIEDKQLTVVVERLDGVPETGPIRFKTDPGRLAIILHNLFSNAVEFNRHGGKITVRIGIIDQGQLVCAVEDTGIGVPATQVNTMFDRFQQLESGTTKRHRGHGLGLSIVKALLDLMEGHISVECAEAQGCTFTITVPEVEMDVAADAFAVDGNEFFFGDDADEAF